jgi:tetratricopeptide (TPR) repeat protein
VTTRSTCRRTTSWADSLYQNGRYGEALQHFEEVRRLDPKDARHAFNAAVAHLKLGGIEATRRCLEAALHSIRDSNRCSPCSPISTCLVAYYLDVLSAIHSHLRPRTYLGIGVETGRSIALHGPRLVRSVSTPRRNSRCSSAPARASSRRPATTTSRLATVRADLEGLPIDLAFIDGMHRFEFALRDFVNIEKTRPRLHHIDHDCYPPTGSPPRESGRR